MKGAAKGPEWDHFTEVESDGKSRKLECGLCGKHLTAASGTRIRAHLVGGETAKKYQTGACKALHGPTAFKTYKDGKTALPPDEKKRRQDLLASFSDKQDQADLAAAAQQEAEDAAEAEWGYSGWAGQTAALSEKEWATGRQESQMCARVLYCLAAKLSVSIKCFFHFL